MHGTPVGAPGKAPPCYSGGSPPFSGAPESDVNVARRQDRNSAIETGRKLHETTLASAEVIARRTFMGAQAMTSPSFEAAAEAGDL